MASPAFREIGKGQCGSIWAVDAPGNAYAFKRQYGMNSDGEHSRSVVKDSEMHQHIEASLRACRTNFMLTHLNIPEHRQLVLQEDVNWWEGHKSRFPVECQPCNTLISERIPPFEQPVRSRLIERFCPEKIKNVVTSSRKDEDCLVRPYLGRRARDSRPSPFFTLRNKAITIDQTVLLELPATEYAHTMADALAFMYWHTKVDANDAEFVLAPTGSHIEAGSWHSETLGNHTMWLLDFDCIKAISMDEDGIAQAAAAFFRNDPYFPRPFGETELDSHLWSSFVQRFLDSSGHILSDSPLPRMMIDALEATGKDRKRKAGAFT